MRYKNVGIEVLLGKTITKIDKTDDEIMFYTEDGGQYKMYHDQNCCEIVYIEDVVGDLSDLLGSPILIAREDTNSDEPKKGEYDDSHTWTFYNIATVKANVTIRWYGTSNGYYSESVDVVNMNQKD